MRRLRESGRMRLSLAAVAGIAVVVGGVVALGERDPAREKTVTPVDSEPVVG